MKLFDSVGKSNFESTNEGFYLNSFSIFRLWSPICTLFNYFWNFTPFEFLSELNLLSKSILYKISPNTFLIILYFFSIIWKIVHRVIIFCNSNSLYEKILYLMLNLINSICTIILVNQSYMLAIICKKKIKRFWVFKILIILSKIEPQYLLKKIQFSISKTAVQHKNCDNIFFSTQYNTSVTSWTWNEMLEKAHIILHK